MPLYLGLKLTLQSQLLHIARFMIWLCVPFVRIWPTLQSQPYIAQIYDLFCYMPLYRSLAYTSKSAIVYSQIQDLCYIFLGLGPRISGLRFKVSLLYSLDLRSILLYTLGMGLCLLFKVSLYQLQIYDLFAICPYQDFRPTLQSQPSYTAQIQDLFCRMPLMRVLCLLFKVSFLYIQI